MVPAPVTRSSLRRVLPIVAPAPMAVVPVRVFAGAQWRRIRLGYRARDMDERWNVFVEDQVVFAHRSCTGHGIYAASLSPVDAGWCIGAAVVESDPTRYRGTSADYDRVMLELILASIVLGELAPALRAELVAIAAGISGRPDLPADVILHSAVGLRSRSVADG